MSVYLERKFIPFRVKEGDTRMEFRWIVFFLALVFGISLGSQEVSAQGNSTLIEVGEMAPDFSMRGATRYGVLEDPVRLSDLRGETVVLAFFFRVRTRG